MGEFKSVLKKLRLAKGMNQVELAEALGITRSRLSMYELGQREPDFETLEMIADYFNVDIDYLMGRTDKTTMIPQSYYLNEEAAKIAQEVFDDPDLRILFDASRNARPEDIRLAAEMLRRFKETNPDG